jgi:hypothetical protein
MEKKEKGGLKLLGDRNQEAMQMFCSSSTGSSSSLLSLAGGGVCNGVLRPQHRRPNHFELCLPRITVSDSL